MLPSVYLLFMVLHVAEACILANHGHSFEIKANISDAVLLPCYCTDVITSQSFRWKKLNEHKNMWDDINGTRVQLFNGVSPGNFSLLVSNLTIGDEGLYRCEVTAENYTYIQLTVQGNSETSQKEELTITAHTGGSILLPCHSTDLNTKPKQFKWRKYSMMKFWSDMSTDGHRFQVSNEQSPGNLSLLISGLIKEDEGVYRCDLGKRRYTDVKLVVKVSPESLPFIPFAMITVIFLHIIVAWVYCTTRKKGTSRVHYYTADGDGSVNIEQ